MKKILLSLMLFASLGLLLAQPADVWVSRAADLDFAYADFALPTADYGLACGFVADPYESVPTYYITAGQLNGLRTLMRLTVPSIDEPQLELLRTFPLYIGDEPYDEWDYPVYVYVMGLTVSEDHIYVGIRTYLQWLDGGDDPEIESGVNGFYIMKFTKDGTLVDLRRNQNEQHRVRGLHYMQLDEPVTLYVDADGLYVEGPGAGIDEYVVDDALLATQWGGYGIFAMDPHNLEYVVGGTAFERNFRPRTYTTPARGQAHDLVYDVEAGDLYLLALTAGTWQEIEYDGPAFLRQKGYNPLDIDSAGVGEGEVVDLLLAPEEEIAGWSYWDAEQDWFQGNPVWSGMDMYVSPDGHKFFALADFWNGYLYLYQVENQPDDSISAIREFTSDRTTFWNKPVDVVFHEEEEGLYMIVLNSYQSKFEVWEVGFVPTFSSSWSLFK